MNGVRRGRMRLFVALLVLWGAAVVGRLVQLQIAQAPRYRARAQSQQERRIEVPGRRGSILDRAGRELAVSVEVSSVYAIPDDVKDPRATARALAPILRLPDGELALRLAQPKGFVWIARKIETATTEKARALKLPGIHLLTESKRFYPKGPLAAAALGFVGTDDRGLGGLEHFYDEAIAGKPGEVVALTDARRFAYGEADTATASPPREGATLTLSLDSGIQFAAENELAAAISASRARSGSVVLLDPSTGEILAMASYPGFDPNRYGRFPEEARRNRAIADAHEPGSTFKIVTAALALEDSLVSLHEIIETGDGTIRISNTTISEHNNKEFGPLTLAGVFEHSSNVGIIRVGLRLPERRLFDGARSLGIGRGTGVDLPGENAGIFRPVEKWSSLSAASISMGQEVSVNPLQLARIAAAVANGGFLVTPRLVTRIALPDGTVEEIPPTPPVRVFSEATARALSDILVGVVERGTGTRAAIAGFAVAGKTGTAQKAGPGGYIPGRYVPNFVGFVPADAPRLAGVVVIEEPRGAYYASEVAAPAFSRIASQALSILRVAPQEQRLPGSVLAAMPAPLPAGLVPAANRRPTSASSRLPASAGVPDALGLTAREALSLFARLGLRPVLHGSGFVTAQDPPPGAPVISGRTHVIYLSETAASAALAPRRLAEESSPAFAVP